MMPVTQAQSAASLFACSPLVVAALHLPDLGGARRMPMAELEDYLLSNAAVFAQGGHPVDHAPGPDQGAGSGHT